MSDAEKAAAFDVLAAALLHRWADGGWSWWCCSPCGGKLRGNRAHALADLLAWARRMAKRKSVSVAR